VRVKIQPSNVGSGSKQTFCAATAVLFFLVKITKRHLISLPFFELTDYFLIFNQATPLGGGVYLFRPILD